MTTQAKIVGVHPVKADEPVYLVEILVEGDFEDFDFGKVTQEIADQPKSSWQVAYDERPLEDSEGMTRFAFFFHYLDFKKPLLTSTGSLTLPKPTEMPTHLQNIEYDLP